LANPDWQGTPTDGDEDLCSVARPNVTGSKHAGRTISPVASCVVPAITAGVERAWKINHENYSV